MHLFLLFNSFYRCISLIVIFFFSVQTCKNMVFFSTCACVNYFSKALERLVQAKRRMLLTMVISSY